jgi:hypothetical protein
MITNILYGHEITNFLMIIILGSHNLGSWLTTQLSISQVWCQIVLIATMKVMEKSLPFLGVFDIFLIEIVYIVWFKERKI